MSEPMFRYLKAEEIDVRIDRINKKGVILLLYKDARCDMNILDETVTPLGWQREHEVINDNLFCKVSIWDDKKSQWISKSDVGVESFMSKEKGEASDSFKRACFNWGIGRELYTPLFLFIPCATQEMKDRDSNIIKGKYEPVDKYVSYNVSDIKTENGVIKFIVIKDGKGRQVYPAKYDEPVADKIDLSKESEIPPENQFAVYKITTPQARHLIDICKGKEDELKGILKRYGFAKTADISVDAYDLIIEEAESL